MSQIMQQYIFQCRASFKSCLGNNNGICSIDPQCDCKCNGYMDCSYCLGRMFYESEHRMRRYQCQPITYSYVEKFTEIFASEIYRILFPLSDIWDNIADKNIVSIGCGPATELIAVEKIMRDKSIQSACQYVGFDMNNSWNSTWNILKTIFQSHNIQLHFQSEILFPNNPVLKNTKLLILNHVISDIYKHTENPSEDTFNFLQNEIIPLIQQMPTDSYILINDVNSNNMGRDEIEIWGNQISSIINIIEMGYFINSKHPDFAKFNNVLARRRNDRDSIFDLYNNVLCQSAYILLKKI